MRAKKYKSAFMMGGLVLALVIAGWAWASENLSKKSNATSAPSTPAAQDAAAALSADDMKTFSQRFQKEIWPLLTRAQSNCAGCHDNNNPSQLHFLSDADASFAQLLRDGRFDPESPTALLARISAPAKAGRMPMAPYKPWTDLEMAVLRSFVNDLFQRRHRGASYDDEQFPAELSTPFKGKPTLYGPDNTFLTFYQLKRKILAIFADDWRRDDKDLFNENIALFGGADFVRSFNESSKASATFLSGVDLLAGDVATRAYTAKTGPFQGRPQTLRSPLGMKAPDAAYRRAINQLYNRILFRNATDEEMRGAFRFLQNVYRSQKDLPLQSQDLRFELTVTGADGLRTTRNFTIHATNDPYGLYQEFINQNVSAAGNAAKHKLNGTLTLKANDAGQQFEISNSNTSGNVSIAGLELKGPLPGEATKTISVDDASVQVLGAWNRNKAGNLISYEDNNDNKGNSRIIIPMRVPEDGKYEVSVIWRKNDAATGKDKRGRPTPALANAERVLVEVLSHDRAHHHAVEPPPPIPPKGEAHFVIDQTLDNIAFWDLHTAFKFGPNDSVEINNAHTRRTVVADAVQFVAAKTDGMFLVRGAEAEGKDQWQEFKPGQFRPYNTTGPKLLSDGNEKKGELRLFYKPSVRKEAWQADQFYRVQVGFPGKAGNETQAPVIVHAQASSPIIQLTYPAHVHVGGAVQMDASATYDLQRSKLNFTWVQTGGPLVELADAHAPKVTFVARPMAAQQTAWEGLCRALIKHPDFLFTRPPSLATVKDKPTRLRLQLVKIAQDLVGRTPSDAELKKFHLCN